nr:uncharacterized protein CTRU02_02293 [Colletotrichum truncatum]KAF6798320.1 hypothetical protein CTRU02_02293 [Colletotrichum truncatum]
MASVGSAQSQAAYVIPHITHDELMLFFDSHLSDAALQTFNTDFFSPEKHASSVNVEPFHQEVDDFYEDEDDGLGYYPDGVKRTLTDEQIAMFRHSEMESLRKEQEKAAERRASAQQKLEAGEVGDDDNLRDNLSAHQPAKTKNKKKRKAGKARNHEPKPDLRKRTWDVVEAGLDSLDYD